MSEGQKQRRRLVGGFGSCSAVWWFLCRRSWRVVRKRLEQPEWNESRLFRFVSVPTSLCDFTRLVLSRHTCKHGYQGEKKKNSPLMCLSENCFPFQSEFTFVFGKKMHRKPLRPAIEARRQQFVRRYQITMCKFPARRSDTDAGFVPDGEMYENVNDAAHGWSIFQGQESSTNMLLATFSWFLHKQMFSACLYTSVPTSEQLSWKLSFFCVPDVRCLFGSSFQLCDVHLQLVWEQTKK